MTVQRLDKLKWHGFCESISGGLAGKRAEIEIASPEAGVQLEAKWLPVVGVVYDPKTDILEIMLEGLDHLVFQPRELYVEFGATGIESLGIVDSDRAWQIVLLRDPLMLPSPANRAFRWSS